MVVAKVEPDKAPVAKVEQVADVQLQVFLAVTGRVQPAIHLEVDAEMHLAKARAAT